MTDKPIVGMKELIDTIEKGGAVALTDGTSIEAALELIKKYQEQNVDLKEFKKQKTNIINQDIESNEGRVQFIRSVIIETLKSLNKKSIKFPGLGKVSHSVRKGGWIIKEEELLIDLLKEEGEDDCFEEKTVLKKTPLNKLLDTWGPIDKIPKGVAERDEEKDSVTITFEKPTTDPALIPVTKKAVEELDVDSINFSNV